jgi:glycosyltransferase involved in cell wall biosynthesis
VCLISHAYLEEGYRSKLRQLGATIPLRLVTPKRFPFAYREATADFSAETSFDWRAYPCVFPLGIRSSTRWILASRDLSLSGYQPDIVHVENEVHSLTVLQALASRRLYAPRARMVVFVWANQPLSGPKGFILNAVSDRVRSRIDFFIAGSQEARALLSAAGVPPERSAVVPQVGIDADYFIPGSATERQAARAELGFMPGDFVLGFVGRFVESKGVLDLLEAAKLLKAEGTENIRLLFVGEGPLKSQLLSHRPQAVVGMAEASAGLRRYYRAMDLLVLPSRTTPTWKEQFGRVLVEAMATGVPVMGSDSGAVPEVVGDVGMVFEEGDVAELARKIKRLQGDAELARDLAQRGRQRAVIRYSGPAVAGATLEIYRRVLESPA